MSERDKNSSSQSATKEVRRLTWGEYLPRLLRHMVKGCVGVFKYVLGTVLLAGLLIFFHSEWLLFGCTERDIRLSGWLLQLIGFIQVAYGLRNTERAFGKPSALERARAYIDDFPSRTVRSVTINLKSAVSAQMSAHGVGVVVRDNPTLEQRLEDIENTVGHLKKETAELQHDLKRETSRLDAKMTDNLRELKEQANENEERFEKLMVGDSHVEWIGVFLFVLGITFASASPELAFWLGHPSYCP